VGTVTKTIGTGSGRDYSTLAGWAASLPANLVTDGNSYVGQCFNDSEFYSTSASLLTLSGHTTDSTHTITLTTGTGQSFGDYALANSNTYTLGYNATAGVGIRSNVAYTNTVNISDSNVTLSKLQLKNDSTGAGESALNTSGSSITVSQCIIVGVGARSSVALSSATGLTYLNCLVVQNATGGTSAQIATFDGGNLAVNCTFVVPSDITQVGYAVYINYGTTNNFKNCAFFGITNSPVQTAGTLTYTTCATNLSSPPAGVTGGLVYANQFVNPVSTAPDYRLSSGSGLRNAGTVDTTDIPAAVDIVGNARPTSGTWDIGAWQYGVPITPVALAGLLAGRLSGGRSGIGGNVLMVMLGYMAQPDSGSPAAVATMAARSRSAAPGKATASGVTPLTGRSAGMGPARPSASFAAMLAGRIKSGSRATASFSLAVLLHGTASAMMRGAAAVASVASMFGRSSSASTLHGTSTTGVNLIALLAAGASRSTGRATPAFAASLSGRSRGIGIARAAGSSVVAVAGLIASAARLRGTPSAQAGLAARSTGRSFGYLSASGVMALFGRLSAALKGRSGLTGITQISGHAASQSLQRATPLPAAKIAAQARASSSATASGTGVTGLRARGTGAATGKGQATGQVGLAAQAGSAARGSARVSASIALSVRATAASVVRAGIAFMMPLAARLRGSDTGSAAPTTTTSLQSRNTLTLKAASRPTASAPVSGRLQVVDASLGMLSVYSALTTLAAFGFAYVSMRGLLGTRANYTGAHLTNEYMDGYSGYGAPSGNSTYIAGGPFAAGSTPVYSAQLMAYFNGVLVPLPGSELNSMTLSIVDTLTGQIINNVSQENILNTDRGTIDNLGNLIISLRPSDTLMNETSAQKIQRSMIIDLTYSSGMMAARHEVDFMITKLPGL
jgi:hypothetical protein